MSRSASEGRARATGNGRPQRQQASRPLLLRPAMEIYRIEDHRRSLLAQAATHDNAQAEPAVPSLAQDGTRAGSIEARRCVRPHEPEGEVLASGEEDAVKRPAVQTGGWIRRCDLRALR
jgi:hypothetical protein